MRALALAWLSSGCLVVSNTTTTTTKVGHVEEPAQMGPVGAAGLDVRLTGTALVIRTSHARICRQQAFDVDEDTEDVSVDFEMLTADRHRSVASVGTIVLDVLLAPITIPVSALITFPYVLIRDGHVARRRELVDDKAFACPVEVPSVHVVVDLPSGARVEGTTDGHGVLELAIPASEPAGNVTVHALGQATALVFAPSPSPAPAAGSP